MVDPLTRARVPFLPFNPRFTIEVINKRQREKLEKVSCTFGWANWSMDDYH
jgi:hypothetical protein